MKFKGAIRADQDDQRAGRSRRNLRLTVELLASDGSVLQVKIRNIADRGLLLETTSPGLAVGDVIQVDLPYKAAISAEVVWAAEPYFGCRLDQQLSGAQLAAALLKSEPTAYRVMQEGSPVAEGSLTKVEEDPVPDFSKVFAIIVGFWMFVGLAFVALT
ncbi:MAG: PilZ domain-containing protein [Sphingopyxis sp.]|nr:PilZ domain-containing protein [Sphingopyxis sp.]